MRKGGKSIPSGQMAHKVLYRQRILKCWPLQAELPGIRAGLLNLKAIVYM